MSIFIAFYSHARENYFNGGTTANRFYGQLKPEA